jgi:hypothetical protein
MPVSAYEGVIAKSYITQPVAAPQNASVSSGMQKSASGSVIGNDPGITPSLVAAPIGSASVVAGFIVYTGSIPS